MKKNFFLYYIFCVLISLNYSHSKNYKNTVNNQDNHDMIINNIYIIGNTKYDKNFILNISKINVGESIDYYEIKINNVVNRLWKSNLFKNISVYKKVKYKNVIDLFIKLEDLMEIHEICIEEEEYGNIIIDKQLSSFIKDKYGDIISEFNIQDIKNEIKNFYKKKGFNEVKIDSKINNEKGKFILHFLINKGKKIEIEEFIFEGNNIINDKDLFSLLKNDKLFLISTIIEKPIRLFIRDSIDKNLEKIKKKYQSLGFRFAKVFLDYVWKKKSGNYGIKIRIIEGKKYYLGDVKFIGNSYVKDKDLKKIFSYNKEDIYNVIKIQKNIVDPSYHSIFNHYLNLGHIFVSIVPIEEVIKENNKINLKIIIKEKLPVYIKNIKIVGNNITKDYVIKRVLKIHTGELFSIEKIKESMHNIEKLFLFEKIFFKIIIDSNDNNYIDIEWNVKEKNNNDFQISGGFNGYNIKKFYGNLKMIFNNLSIKNIPRYKSWDPIPQGDGDKLIIFSNLEKDFKSIGVSLVKPWIYINDSTSLKIENDFSIKKLFNNDNHPFDDNYLINKNDEFLLKKIKNSLELKKEISVYPNLKVVTSINREKIVTPKDTDRSIYGKKGIFNFKNLYYLFSINRNLTNKESFPFKGSIFNLEIMSSFPYNIIGNIYEKNKKELNSSNFSITKIIPKEKKTIVMNYFKFKLSGNWYKKIYRNLVMNLGGEMGHIGLFNDNTDESFMKKIPPVHRFRMGGYEKKSENHIPLKGYSFSDNFSTYKMSKYGGTTYKKIFMEIRYLINKSYNNRIKSWFTTFIEGGNIGNSYKSLISKKINKTIGFGFRFFCKPIGLFGLDLSYPIDYMENKNFLESTKWKSNFFITKNN
ncbi:BamA/OMP85 family outer membrane protein [Blattabacterium cuenoti]|uniref:BamA/OMP85 family outer membrane protein n=1 Tax=Blattabacterium cuenoti TaxID=1653831 RepID=UPI00163C9EAF|nr:POTRA domain-containing protein [Blattabacterium cuenoti]